MVDVSCVIKLLCEYFVVVFLSECLFDYVCRRIWWLKCNRVVWFVGLFLKVWMVDLFKINYLKKVNKNNGKLLNLINFFFLGMGIVIYIFD